MHAGGVHRSVGFPVLLVLFLTSTAAAERAAISLAPATNKAERGRRLQLENPVASLPFLAAMDSIEVITCFDETLEEIINPGCFNNPGGGGGDCVSTAQHFLAQFFDPFDYLGDFTGTWRVREVAFISNDGDTTWPSVGIVLRHFTNAAFPSPADLQALQITNVPSAGDAGEVVVDLTGANIEFTVDNVFYMVIQFPAGTLSAPLQGPGIIADDLGTDYNCDFLTLDMGTTWLSPDPINDPLDWGFAVVIEPATAVDAQTWSAVKLIYRSTSGR
jgi:hypothetical protein